MPVNASNDIIKKARELEMVRKLGDKGKVVPKSEIKELKKTIRILEMKIDKINKKLDELLKKRENLQMKDVHKRILNLLTDWMSTERLSDALGYSQEYVSRKISELKEMDKIEEKRSGKNLYYQRKE